MYSYVSLLGHLSSSSALNFVSKQIFIFAMIHVCLWFTFSWLLSDLGIISQASLILS